MIPSDDTILLATFLRNVRTKCHSSMKFSVTLLSEYNNREGTNATAKCYEYFAYFHQIP